MDTSAKFGSPGIDFGCFGFSSKPMMRQSALISITPNCDASSILTGSAATVTSADFFW